MALSSLLISLQFLVLAGCAPSPAKFEAIPLPTVVPRLAGVLGVDAVLGDGGVMHCVSYGHYGEGMSSGFQLYYHRGRRSDHGWQWDPPVLLGTNARGARLVRTPGRLHAITGHMLRRYTSDDDGRSWQDAGDLVDAAAQSPDGVDVMAVGDTLFVSFLTSYLLEVPLRTTRKGMRLHVLRVDPNHREERILAEFPLPLVAQPGTRLAFEQGVLHVIMGLSADSGVWAEAAGVTPPPHGGSSVQFLHATSSDGARSWTQLRPLPAEGGWDAGRFGRVSNFGFGIPALSLVIDKSGPLLVWGATGLYDQHLAPGGAWSKPNRIHRSFVREQSFELGHTSIEAIRTRERDVVAWIDESHPRGGRRSNDILVGIANRTSPPRWQVRRITAPGLFTNSISALVDGDSLYVLRVGRGAKGISLSPYDPRADLSICAVPLREGRGPSATGVRRE